MLAKEVAFVASVAFTLTESFKIAGMQKKYAPIASWVIGIGLGFLLGLGPIFGLLGGISASGLYSGIKKSAE